MGKDEETARLMRRRDRARRLLVVSVILLLLFGFGYSFSSTLSFGGGGNLLAVLWSTEVAATILLGTLILVLGSAALWGFWGWRLGRLNDPWAYDPDLDGPDPRVRRGLEDAREPPDRGPPR